MADIEAGKIDILVIYKLDRLSRSLLMAEFFEQHNVIISHEDANEPQSSNAEPTALARRLAQAHYYLYLLESGKYPS